MFLPDPTTAKISCCDNIFFYQEILLLRCVSLAKKKIIVVLLSLTFRFLYKTTTIIANYIKYTDTCKLLVSHRHRCVPSAHLYYTVRSRLRCYRTQLFVKKRLLPVFSTLLLLFVYYFLRIIFRQKLNNNSSSYFSREEEISAFWNWVGFVMLASPAAGTD